jgi:hypothetical protein
MQSIGGFKLRNNGGFVCAGKVQYMDSLEAEVLGCPTGGAGSPSAKKR